MIIFSIYINRKLNFFLIKHPILRHHSHNYPNFWTLIDFNADNYILWIMLIYSPYQMYIIYFLPKINAAHGTLRTQKPHQKLTQTTPSHQTITHFYLHYQNALRAHVPFYRRRPVWRKQKYGKNSWYLGA